MAKETTKFGPILLMIVLGLAIMYFAVFMFPGCSVPSTCAWYDIPCQINAGLQGTQYILCEGQMFIFKSITIGVGALLILIAALKYR